jgi:phosphoribosylformylglycinamidine synthase subunit PurL
VKDLLHRELGLTDDEFGDLTGVLGRDPNELELAMVSVMWSEHCSYKSSRIHLRRLPTEGPGVLVGPGENAGVVDVGDGIAVAIRIESHNHPSAIEPYQGAATGVGGIIRDIFTMGARPIALLDPLFFGELDDLKNRWLLDGVVAGIAGYGNAVGVPTVGGELTIDDCYSRNPLVNVMCIGLLPVDRLVLGRAAGEGNLAVLLGSTTGRDGIGGVSVLASAGFAADDGEGSKRPSVQVGDPFEEKRLIEASLELLDGGLVVGIQDLGGAGLTCATSETAARAGNGMDVYVSGVPLREPGMSAAEIMTSESQERMLAIVEPKNLETVEALCAKWEVRASVVGTVTTGGRLRIMDEPGGEVLADLPAALLSDEAPCYERPLARPATAGPQSAAGASPSEVDAEVDGGVDADGAGEDSLEDEVLSMLMDSSWIYRQYDHMLFLNTVEGPGGDASVLRVAGPGLPPSRRAIAVSADSNPRWCSTDPRIGATWIVAESAINVACAGARGVALVNCLNFGNPEHPEVMWQLSESVDGIAEACRALGLPVVGGNVSLYNESLGTDISPTPVVSVLGVIDELTGPPPGVRLREGSSIVLLGGRGEGLAGSRLSRRQSNGISSTGTGPGLEPVDYEAIGALVQLLIRCAGGSVGGSVDDTPGGGIADLIDGVHDVSDGGLALCLCEMAARSQVGFRIEAPFEIANLSDLFSERPGRVVVCTRDADALLGLAHGLQVPATVIGAAEGDRVTVPGFFDLPLSVVTETWDTALPRALGESEEIPGSRTVSSRY